MSEMSEVREDTEGEVRSLQQELSRERDAATKRRTEEHYEDRR